MKHINPESRIAMKQRLTKIEYALKIAEAAACRSEDLFYQVGAVALDKDWRVVATAYNGLPSGISQSEEWWKDKEFRRPFIIHAEQNLCSLFTRGQVESVVVTLQPCVECFRLLVAHDVKRIYYKQPHRRTKPNSVDIARCYRCCEMVQV